MRVLLCFLLMVSIVLCGCQGETRDVLETVEDEISVFSQEMYMEISVFVPQETGTVRLRETPSEFVSEDGNYCVRTCRILANSPESAMRQITQNGSVTVLQVSRFQLPEYRFVWAEQGAQTMRYRGRMVQDGDVYYAVIFGVKESAGNQYDDVMMQVFSSFGLYFDEEV